MKLIHLYLIILLTLVPISTAQQNNNQFIILIDQKITLTPNDIQQDGQPPEIHLLDDNTTISEEKDEIRLQLNITKTSELVDVKLQFIKKLTTSNNSYPLQYIEEKYSVKIANLNTSSNIDVLLHWHSLLPEPTCSSCEFIEESQINLQFLDINDQWDADVEASTRIGHRDRIVTLYDFINITLDTPGVNIGEATISSTQSTEYFEETSSNTIKDTTELSEVDASESKNIISSISDKLVFFHVYLVSSLIILTIVIRKFNHN